MKCLVMQFMHRTQNTQQEKLLINKCMTNNQLWHKLSTKLTEHAFEGVRRNREDSSTLHVTLPGAQLTVMFMLLNKLLHSLDASFTCGHDVKNGERVWNWTNLAYFGIESACTILSMLLLDVATTKRKRQQQETLHANGVLDHSMEDWEAFWPAILTPLQKNCKGRYIDEHI
jgi:hypothetical protein